MKKLTLQPYIGCKIIKAVEMDRLTFERTIKGKKLDSENQTGYLVEYPDGYKSWSPKSVFENAYRKITAGETALIA